MSSRPQRFLDACQGKAVDATPVWLMRQAGRYMPEYRAIRAKHSMLDVINTPELACEVTMQPINAFDLDAAIIFSDILPPLMGMGLELDFIKGVGPRLGNPLRSVSDIAGLRTDSTEETMTGTLQAIRLVKKELANRSVPLIGFCGAPFTLASYAIEGGGSKSYAKTKTLMYSDPSTWKILMEKLVAVLSEYLALQVAAGADTVQIFDSWAGAVGKDDYERFVKPYTTKLIVAAQKTDVPVINFSTGTLSHIESVADAGGDVVGVDFRLPLDEVWARIGFERPIMGNLDPVSLFAPWEVLKERIDVVLMQAKGRSGHIFNLGHGILPETPVDNVRRMVDYVHEQTSQ